MSNQAEGWQNTSVKMEDGAEQEAPVNKNLIINYLPQTLSDKEFFSMFSSMGAIKQCRIMRNMQTGYSFGYGFVEYTNPDDADKAIAQLNGLQVQHKNIKVSFARPPGEDIKDTNLYIQNLPRNIDETYLDVLFAPFGKIVQRRLLLEKYTKLPRGVGFVRFSKRDEAQAAILELDGKIPEGGTQPLNVKVAQDYSKTKQQSMMQQHMPGFQGGYGGGGRGQPRGRGGRGGGRGGGGPPAPGMIPPPPRPAFPPPNYAAQMAAGKPDFAADYAAAYGAYGDFAAAGADYAAYGGYSGGYPVAGAGYDATGYGADPSAWQAGNARGANRRGGRGFNKAMQSKTNNRFNPMGSNV